MGITLWPMLGCLNECQQLCNSWYGFRQSVCGDAVEATDLNRCLSDHRSLLAEAEDDEVCGFYLEFVDQLDDGDEELCSAKLPGDGAHQFDLAADDPEDEP